MSRKLGLCLQVSEHRNAVEKCILFGNSIAIVTGGGSGIGRCLCQALGKGRAELVVADINYENAAEAALAVKAAGGRATAARIDVTQADDFKGLVHDTVRRFGRLDYIFNNAGATVIGEVRDLKLVHWQRVIETNLWGVIHGTVAAYEQMAKQGSGHIVNIASGYGLFPGAAMVPYVASKFAVVGLSESLRIEGADLGVKVSVACPGFVRTSMIEHGVGIGITTKDLYGLMPFGLLDPEVCAKRILRGVARNQAVIAFPFYVRALTWMYRFAPWLGFRLARKMTKDLRKRRSKSLASAVSNGTSG